jgi:peptidoglycan-N-acetylmuramic acid deacetylase
VKRVAYVMLACVILILLFAIPAHTNASKPYHFGYKKSINHKLASINEEGFKRIVQEQGGIFLGDTSMKELYLTFDNGYENGYTAKVLDILKANQVPAIFFVTGHYVKDKPELVKRMAAEGHLVGNHSWHHPDLTQVSTERLKEELEKVRTDVTALTGQKEMKYLRPPRGIFDERTLRESKALGYTNVFWSIAYRDWEPNAQKGADYAYTKVMEQLHPGAVILLHTVSRDNAEALGRIIADARKQGYEFKSLDQMSVRNY